jgi:hypothetical protein
MKSGTLLLNWELQGIRGIYLILPEALEKGTRLCPHQGIPFQTLVLSNDETFCMISRFEFKELLKNKQFIYNNTTYLLNKNNKEILLNNKTLDVLHVNAQIDKTKMWILNNPDFLIVCKIIKKVHWG